MWLPRLDHKRHCSFHPAQLIWGRPVVMCEDTSRPLEKSTWWRTEPPCQQTASTCQPGEWAIQTSLQNVCGHDQHLDYNLMKSPERPQNHQKLVPNSWPNNEIISVCHCFKPLNFQVICYTAIDDWHKRWFNSILYAHITLILKILIFCMILFSGILNWPQNVRSWTKWRLISSACIYKNQTFSDLALQYLNLRRTIKQGHLDSVLSSIFNVWFSFSLAKNAAIKGGIGIGGGQGADRDQPMII